jgi:FKBP-type peptidyl-prolyl cis-trans isomerase 2
MIFNRKQLFMMKQAQQNDTVKVHYKGLLENGEVFDSSEGRDPLQFTLGKGQVIPGFEQGIEGMVVEQEKTLKIPAADAYGEINDQLIQEVPIAALSDEITPEVGLKLVSKTPEGMEIPIVVTEVKDESITIDANHPLAGKELIFEVKLLEIV